MHKRILVGVIKGENNFGAMALVYPGCVAVGATAAEAKKRLSEALVTHIQGMLEDGEALPEDIVDSEVLELSIEIPVEATHN